MFRWSFHCSLVCLCPFRAASLPAACLSLPSTQHPQLRPVRSFWWVFCPPPLSFLAFQRSIPFKSTWRFSASLFASFCHTKTSRKSGTFPPGGFLFSLNIFSFSAHLIVNVRKNSPAHVGCQWNDVILSTGQRFLGFLSLKKNWSFFIGHAVKASSGSCVFVSPVPSFSLSLFFYYPTCSSLRSVLLCVVHTRDPEEHHAQRDDHADVGSDIDLRGRRAVWWPEDRCGSPSGRLRWTLRLRHHCESYYWATTISSFFGARYSFFLWVFFLVRSVHCKEVEPSVRFCTLHFF